MTVTPLQQPIDATVPIRQPSQKASKLRRALASGDAAAALAAWTIAAILPGSHLARVIDDPSGTRVITAVLLLALATGLSLLVFAGERLYLSRVCAMRTVEIARIGRASLVLGAAALVTGRLLGEDKMARFPIMVGVLLFFFINFWRMGFSTWLKRARLHGRFTRPVLIIGVNDDGAHLCHLVNAHPELGYRVAGVVGSPLEMRKFDFGDAPFFGDVYSLERTLQEVDLNGAIVSGVALSRTDLNKTVRLLLTYGLHVQMSPGITGIDQRRIRSQSISYEPMLYLERADLDAWQLTIKRIMDVSIASAILLLASPVMLIAALLVKRHDRGPVFFQQERVGRHGKLFMMYKFRSMVTNAEAQLIELRADNVRQGPLFKLQKDPRVTPIGRILRATSIDEMPQLLNVLKGDMSLVGPRPALQSEAETFDEALMARQHVLPGITGLWQVEGRDSPDFTLYQRFDVFYVENWSVLLDLSILVNTFKVVIARALRVLRRDKPGSPIGSVTPLE